MVRPTDIKLYNKIKKEIYIKYPIHSAYRSGLLVQKYKEEYEKKYNNKNYYIGKKPDKNGLNAWFKQKWRNSNNNVGYESKNNEIYRPTKKYGKTPILMNELSKEQKQKAKKIKASGKRIKNFNKL